MAAEARSAELAQSLSKLRQRGRELAKQNTTLLQEFVIPASERVPSRIGGAGEVSERSLELDLMHEKIKVTQLERKAKNMEPLLVKLKAKIGSLQIQVSQASIPAILKGYFIGIIKTGLIHSLIHHTQPSRTSIVAHCFWYANDFIRFSLFRTCCLLLPSPIHHIQRNAIFYQVCFIAIPGMLLKKQILPR